MAVVNPVDRKEYLKKYLSGPQKSNSKKKKKVVASRSRIIDDDIDISKITPDSEKSDHELEDEAPVVAVVIDDRPLNIRAKEAYVTTHWKTLDVSSGKNDDNSNDGPSSRKRHDSSSDSSPPRKSKKDSDSNSSIIAKKSGSASSRKRHDSSDSDISPPRNQGRTKRDSDSDISPPRRGNKSKYHGYNQKINNRDSDSDLDLPRGRNQSNSSPRNVKKSRRDMSSSRNNDSDISPPRKRKISRQDSDSDISPPRIRPNADNSNNRHVKNEFRSRKNHDKSISKSKETLSGLKAGLQDAKALRTELQLAKKREEEMIKKIGEEVSGKNAETIFRDKHTGKRRNLKEEKRLQRIENEKKAKFDEKYMEWGKGLKQVEERENQLGEDVYEMSKPLARYADDEDLEKHLKEKEREGDPMLKFIKKKKEKQIDPSKVRPTYKGPPPPPNRFSIPPGYRWDGVDRSNGFEKKIFERQANKIAQVEEAYKWSVMDM